MILFQRLIAITWLFALMGSANAKTFIFYDTPLKKILITESGVPKTIPGPGFDGEVAPQGPITRAIDYTPLRKIKSAILTVQLSDDTSSTLGKHFVDVPSEKAMLYSVTGTSTITPLSIAEVDGNSIVVPGTPPPVASGLPLMLDVATFPPPGTTSGYFDVDVTSIVSLVGGTLSYELLALSFYDVIPILPGFGGGPYVEDFIYNGAKLTINGNAVKGRAVPDGANLTIEGTAVPVPPSLLLLGTALFGFIGFFRKKTPVA